MEAFEQQPESDMAAIMQLQAALLAKNHPGWLEDTGKTLGLHEKEMESFGKDFRNFIEEHPDVVVHYKENPEDTIQELENKFYH